MQNVKLGLLGYGGMGASHGKYLDEIEGCKVAAVADEAQDARDRAAKQHPDATIFPDAFEVIASGDVDAILIAVPHYLHPPLAMAAFERGIHVLTEKPVAVTAKAAQETDDAYAAALKKHPKLKYAGMFQQRMRPIWREVKRLIERGEVGELVRASWTITNWFRSQAYYNSGGWRATWAGEGGGVLINQCPHQLDLFQWFVGLPSKVTAIVGLGRHHDIEVEDDVTAILEFANGAAGTWITSTGQSPGINRLEIIGDTGSILVDEEGHLTLFRSDQTVREFSRTTPERFAKMPQDKHIIQPAGKDAAHRGISENFIASILRDEPLVAPAVEGIRGLELGNAMLMSGLKGVTVPIPMDREAFAGMIEELKSTSTFKKTVEAAAPADLAGSF